MSYGTKHWIEGPDGRVHEYEWRGPDPQDHWYCEDAPVGGSEFLMKQGYHYIKPAE